MLPKGSDGTTKLRRARKKQDDNAPAASTDVKQPPPNEVDHRTTDVLLVLKTTTTAFLNNPANNQGLSSLLEQACNALSVAAPHLVLSAVPTLPRALLHAIDPSSAVDLLQLIIIFLRLAASTETLTSPTAKTSMFAQPAAPNQVSTRAAQWSISQLTALLRDECNLNKLTAQASAPRNVIDSKAIDILVTLASPSTICGDAQTQNSTKGINSFNDTKTSPIYLSSNALNDLAPFAHHQQLTSLLSAWTSAAFSADHPLAAPEQRPIPTELARVLQEQDSDIRVVVAAADPIAADRESMTVSMKISCSTSTSEAMHIATPLGLIAARDARAHWRLMDNMLQAMRAENEPFSIGVWNERWWTREVFGITVDALVDEEDGGLPLRMWPPMRTMVRQLVVLDRAIRQGNIRAGPMAMKVVVNAAGLSAEGDVGSAAIHASLLVIERLLERACWAVGRCVHEGIQDDCRDMAVVVTAVSVTRLGNEVVEVRKLLCERVDEIAKLVAFGRIRAHRRVVVCGFLGAALVGAHGEDVNVMGLGEVNKVELKELERAGVLAQNLVTKRQRVKD